jgi:hypothetical protein
MIAPQSCELLTRCESILVLQPCPLRRRRATARKAWITPATSFLKMAKRENQPQLIARKMSFSPWHWRRVKKDPRQFGADAGESCN